MKQRNIIQGGRAELERELLEALFTPGVEASVHDLKTRLVPRGQGKLRLVSGMAHKRISSKTGANPGPHKN